MPKKLSFQSISCIICWSSPLFCFYHSIDRLPGSCWITNKPSAKSMERFSALILLLLRLPQETKSSHRYILSGSVPYHAVLFIFAYLLRLERKTPKQHSTHTQGGRISKKKIKKKSPFLRRSEMLGLKMRSNGERGKKEKIPKHKHRKARRR